MILRSLTPKLPLSSITPLNLLKSTTLPLTSHRHASSIYPPRPIPPPTPFVPDVPTFLRLIGRELTQHASKIESWDALFNLSSKQMRDLGIEPARSRRYLLWWREKFRRGEYGIGGDLKHVQDGVAEVRVVEREGKKPAVVNTPFGAEDGVVDGVVDGAEGGKVAGVKIVESGALAGSYFQPVKGSHGRIARIQVQDGIWEVKRGRKVLGGERRRKYNLAVLKRKAREAAA